MKLLLLRLSILLLINSVVAQTPDSPRQQTFKFPLQATVNIAESKVDYKPTLLIKEMPKQGASKMVHYNYLETPTHSKQKSPVSLPGLVKGQSFIGNQFSISTPCDNDIAISDSGLVASVMNTTIFFRNTNIATPSPGKSLSVFTTPINNDHQEFDPKVMYDPEADRFVLLCLVGNVDTTSKVVLGFSQTNNPGGIWNLYTLPGDALNNGLWTDYPMIAMTKKELFLSVNLLYNDSSWQTGFVETIVWQMDKKNGYLGQPLATNLHSNIKYNGKAIRNLCPAKGGSKLYSPNMLFVSNRNLASQNDTVFVVNITDTIGSSTNTVTTKALKSNQPYFFPPDGRQPLAGQTLATNDSRNLGAFYENDKIQYVHNTRNPANNRVTLYYGVIESPLSTTATVAGYIVPNDTMDFAYPNISYSGNSGTDNMSIITFDHSSNKINPGVSAIQADGLGNFSTVLRIQNGSESVNLLTGSLERWGDYSGSQRRYNIPGEVWMSGYVGNSYSQSFPKAHAAWIAQITNSVVPFDDTQVGENFETDVQSTLYPNPATVLFSVEFTLIKPEYLTFELFDPQGKLVTVLLRDWVKTNTNVFSFNTADLNKGVYILKISGNNHTNISKKVIIQ